MRDRYLFSADLKTSEYKHVLEITQGRARLLTPSGSAWGWRWAGSLGVFIGYSMLMWPLGRILLGGAVILGPLAAWIVIGSVSVVWIFGLFLVFFLWDRKSLRFLADDPAHATDLVLLGARSFGAFQDVRARTREGEELHLVVDARSQGFWEAVRLLEGKPVSSR